MDDVVGEELCGVAGCIGLWRCRVDIQRHTTVDARNKTAKKFEQYKMVCVINS